MYNNKITIIIPVYNMEEYIEECLNSVITQTLKKVEILCIDDCSTDNSEKIIKNFKDHRIRYIKLDKNSGSAIARNTGINKASGEFVIFMDPDDYYYDNMALELLYNSAKKKNLDIVAANILTLDTKNNKQEVFRGALHFVETKLYSFRTDYLSCFGYQSFLFNTNFLKNNDLYFPNYLRRQDPPFLLKVMLLHDIFLGINHFVYVYRLFHKKVNWDRNKKIDFINAYKNNFEIFAKEDLPEHFMREFLDFKYHVLLENQFPITNDILLNIEETKKSISFNLIRNSINSKIQEHEKCYLNNLLDKLNDYRNKKIIIYGFGNIGIELYEKIKNNHIIEQIIDKNLYGIIVDIHEISKNIKKVSLDNLIIITVHNQQSKNEIIDTFIKNGILKEQIL